MISGTSTRLPIRIIAMSAVLVLVALVFSGGGHAAAGVQKSSGPRPTIVLVHGDWADASSWNDVITPLQDRGFTVVAPPNSLRGPSQDARTSPAASKRSPVRSCSWRTPTAAS
jgi:pimeloyl-ACP methyl ester carboxylesterase